MPLLVVFLLFAAFLCFAVAAAGVPTGRLNVVALGLALCAVAWLLPASRTAGLHAD